MKRALLLIVGLFLVGSIIWLAFHGQWESAYVVQDNFGTHRYLMDLNSRPLWSQPIQPSFAEFSQHFSGSGEPPLPEGGHIVVYHKWDWWILDLILIWLIGFLVITPIGLLFFRRDRAWGALARVGLGLIGAALACFLLWLSIGGWGPPVPLFFGGVGLVVGGVWAAVHGSKSTAN